MMLDVYIVMPNSYPKRIVYLKIIKNPSEFPKDFIFRFSLFLS